MFGLGLIPSGSRDPFGLRRAAQGVVRTLLEGGIDLDLRAAGELALRQYGETLPAQAAERIPTLIAFLEERVRYLLGLEGFAYDEIEAGLKAGWRSLPDLRRRVAALHASRERPGFVQVVLAAKRIANIVKGTESTALSPERLAEGAERDLYVASAELAAGLDADLGRGDYEPSLSRIADLAGVLDRFFVDILVMDPDPAVRANRLALLRDVGAQLGRVAALTEMVVDKSELKER
jgi:glycyl-tRNA synthetase beta chain